jgi:serine/threonine protein kinase
MPKPSPLAAGDPTQVGPYVLLSRLGRGGMGEVFLGRRGETLVAVKLILPEWAEQEAFLARFRREVAAARRVPDLWTARVLESGLDGSRPYLVTEYVDGDRLDEFVDRRGPLTGTTLEKTAFEVAAALTAIHAAGVVHRDLKPSNVLITSQGVKVIDFGIARALDAGTSITGTDIVVGTPGWMAPEQLLGEPVTSAADVFIWGRLVLYAATGRPPPSDELVDPTAPAPNWDGLGDPLRGLVRAALNREPSRRPRAKAITLELLGTGVSNPDAAATERLVSMTASDRVATEPQGRAPTSPLASPGRSSPQATRRPRRFSDGVVVGAAAWLLAGLAVLYELAWGDLADVLAFFVGLAMLLTVGLAIASVAAAGTRRSRLPNDVQRALRGNTRQRLSAVSQLKELRATNRSGLAVAADIALEQLARDSHRRVRTAASEALRGSPSLRWRERTSSELTDRLSAMAGQGWEALRVRIWPPRGRAELAATAACVAEFHHPAPIVAAGVDGEGRRVVTRCAEHRLRVWNQRGGDPLVEVRLPDAIVAAGGVAVSADGTWMSAAGTATVAIWSMTSGSQVDRFEHNAPTQAVTFSSDGLRLVAASVEDHGRAVVMARAWELSTGRQHRLVRTEGTLPWTRPLALAVSPDGHRLAAVGGLSGAARVWDLHSGRATGLWWPVRMRGNRTIPLAFSGRANLLAIVGRRGRLIRIWDVNAGQIIRRFQAAGRIHALAFAADGWRLATGGDNFVQVWDLSQDGEVERLWHGSRVTALAFSGDATSLVTAGTDSICRIWQFNRHPDAFEEDPA